MSTEVALQHAHTTDWRGTTESVRIDAVADGVNIFTQTQCIHVSDEYLVYLLTIVESEQILERMKK